MTNFLSRVLGAEVPIVKKAKVAGGGEEGGATIYLGVGEWVRQAGLDIAQLKEDGYFIRSVPDGVVIAGVDDAFVDPFTAIKTGRSQSGRRATLNGVYGFLERYAGCRFYFPGELGEIVPRKDRIEVAADLRDEPNFNVRVSSGPYANTIWFPPWGANYHSPRMLNWFRLRTSGRGRPMTHGSRFMQLKRRFGKTHPEYFCASRGKDGNLSYRTDPRDVYTPLCWSSGVRDEIVKDIIAYMNGAEASSRGYVRERKGKCDAKGWPTDTFSPDVICIDADDGYVQCGCDACTAAVDEWTAMHPKASPASLLMWRAWSDIGKKVKAAGVKCRLSELAYSAYQDMPDIELADNLFVGCARTGGWAYGAHERYGREISEVKGWAEKTHGRTHLHNWSLKYGSVNIPGLPSVTPKAVAQYYRDVAPYACSVLNETTSDRYAHIYLNDYMMAKTTWDPMFDAEAALAEHHRLMFGAAAPEMTTLFTEMEDIWINKIMAGKMTMTPLGPQVATPNPFEIWRVIYSQKLVARWTKLFDEAERKLSDLSQSSLCRRRVALLRSEILDVLVKTRQDFIVGTDAEAEEARRKREGVKNLLGKEYSFEFYVPAEKPEKDHERATPQTQAVIPYVFDTNATYRLSCFLETEDVVRTASDHRFNGANIALWAHPGWVWPSKTGATIGSTFGRVHQSIVFKGSICFRPEEQPEMNICHGISVWLRGATGRMKVDGLILENVGK